MWLNQKNVNQFKPVQQSRINPMHLFFLTADEHFAPWGHFTPQHFLLLNTFCSLEHFVPQHILPSGTLCFFEHFAPWIHLDSSVQNVPGSKKC